MSRVRVLVGTRKGAFVLTADGKRDRWDVSGLFGLLSQEQGGVAFWAHTGGFAAGLVLIKLFARRDDVMAHGSQQWEPRRLVGR